jgi:hypothetical protein
LIDHLGGWSSPSSSWEGDDAGETLLGTDEEFQPLDLLDELEGVAETVTASDGESIDDVGTTVYDIVLDADAALAHQLEQIDEMELPEGMTEDDREEMREAARTSEMPEVLRVWVGDDGLLRRFLVEGGATASVTGGPTGMIFDFDRYGVPVTVPTAGSVTAWSDLGIADPYAGVLGESLSPNFSSDDDCWPAFDDFDEGEWSDEPAEPPIDDPLVDDELLAEIEAILEACDMEAAGPPNECFVEKIGEMVPPELLEEFGEELPNG